LIIRPTKADIGRNAIVDSDVLQHLARRRDNGDAAIDKGGDTDVAVTINC